MFLFTCIDLLLILWLFHATYHLNTQCASSTATATTVSERGGQTRSCLHVESEPNMASGALYSRWKRPRDTSFPVASSSFDIYTMNKFHFKYLCSQMLYVSTYQCFQRELQGTPLLCNPDTWSTMKETSGEITKTTLRSTCGTVVRFNLKSNNNGISWKQIDFP